MKTVSLFDNYGALNSKPVFDAFKIGLERHGYTVKHNSLDADVAVIWSMLWHGRMAYNRQIYNHFRKLNKDVIILEVGGISRGNTWRVGLNGISRSKLLYNTQALSINLTLCPWRESGNTILICGQNEKSELWNNMPSMDKWINKTVESIRAHTKMPIVIRPHPRFPLPNLKINYTDVLIQNPLRVASTYDSFDLSFDNLHAVVCWSSTPGPGAILNGVPVFTGPDSIAYPVANIDFSRITEPHMPDRSGWLVDYMRSEYTLADLKLGMPLKTLTKV